MTDTIKEYWYWYHRYFDRMYGQSFSGYLLYFAMTPLVVTAKAIILPFQLIQQRNQNLQKEQEQNEQLMKDEPIWNQNQNVLKNQQLFKQKLQEIKLNDKVLIVLTQRIQGKQKSANTKRPKGCLIVASKSSSMNQFFPHLRKFVGIRNVQSIALYHKAKMINQIIPPNRDFRWLQNQNGLIELEFVLMEAMG